MQTPRGEVLMVTGGDVGNTLAAVVDSSISKGGSKGCIIVAIHHRRRMDTALGHWGQG